MRADREHNYERHEGAGQKGRMEREDKKRTHVRNRRIPGKGAAEVGLKKG